LETAHQAQSVELYLLLPVVELASTTKDFYITLWQHDGFSVHFTNKSKVDYWIKKIQSVVQSKIDEQGILTHLEWELL
jgi:G:T-mismatch repair DNA endonuclease (very short patch repair protein)